MLKDESHTVQLQVQADPSERLFSSSGLAICPPNMLPDLQISTLKTKKLV